MIVRSPQATLRLAVLTCAFGAAVAMWAVGYLCRIPPVLVPPPVMLPMMALCLVAGGYFVGRDTGRGLSAGAATGLVSGIINLLIIGSVIGGAAEAGRPPSWMWGPGSLIVSAALGAIGAILGHRRRSDHPVDAMAWRSRFLGVATVATLLVVIAGGLVTSLEAGLAVPDWPNSYGSNMFLYPLARMTGGIYYEHAHRLYGALVGLTTITVAVILWSDGRRSLRGLGLVAVAWVILQGVLGGLRVTGRFTLDDDPAALAPRLELAIVHGVTGQLFFAYMAFLWALVSRRWQQATTATIPPTSDRSLLATLSALLMVQLILGAMFRHLATPETPLPWPSMLHIALAAVVALLAYLAGLRLWAVHAERHPLPTLGRLLVVFVSIQLVVGVAALALVMANRESWLVGEVILATAHQANGALLLATAVAATVWTWRLLPAATASPAPA